MKKGNIATIDHNGRFLLCEVMTIKHDKITVKIFTTGKEMTVYDNELIIVADSL